MRRRNRYLLPLVILIVLSGRLDAQQSFSLAAYREFLARNADINSGELRAMYPAGNFRGEMVTDFSQALFAVTIDHYYGLTDGEKSLINRHGFMVSERLQRGSFGEAFLEIFQKDLPVFVSTDAIMHALHMSYDAMLMDIEGSILIPRLDSLLGVLHSQLPALASRYGSLPFMDTVLNDFDVYLTVPRTLMNTAGVKPVFPGNAAVVNDLLELIKEQQAAPYPLFAEADHDRDLDFSQFTPRGHYTRAPRLTGYFQAMIWLGRTEMYLTAPKTPTKVSVRDVQRQILLSALVHEAAERANAYPLLEEIDHTIRAFVGESDNVTLPNVGELLTESGVTAASDLLDTNVVHRFQEALRTKPYADQKILSQILEGDPMSATTVAASAFLLLGQRFVIDSYITGNVVYDRIHALRMLPSMLDILFALGNNATAQLLQPELARYGYAPNLAALHYLVDSYQPEFWNGTVYNGWLNSIRSLNPPLDKSGLPSFMQTAAWWQQKMNGQLASWAQLRHDNLLYVKQSYSGTISGCSYPKSMVEPVPEFYQSIGAFAENALEKFGSITFRDTSSRSMMLSYFENMRDIAGTLESIAVKELANTELSDDEIVFLKTMISKDQHDGGCGTIVTVNGWYPSLFYSTWQYGTSSTPEMVEDMVVADVHTAPTDEDGNPVGWVVHAGTGPLNMAVIVCSHDDGKATAYVGPVMSYYEQVSTNFKRLTDEEWKTAYATPPSSRPDWTRLYLADKTGNDRSAGAPMLTSGVDDEPAAPAAPASPIILQNAPNPFGTSTTISFSIPRALTGDEGTLAVYNAAGDRVNVLLHRALPAGSYSTRWDATADDGSPVPDGTYFSTLTIGGKTVSGKMTVMRGER